MSWSCSANAVGKEMFQAAIREISEENQFIPFVKRLGMQLSETVHEAADFSLAASGHSTDSHKDGGFGINFSYKVKPQEVTVNGNERTEGQSTSDQGRLQQSETGQSVLGDPGRGNESTEHNGTAEDRGVGVTSTEVLGRESNGGLGAPLTVPSVPKTVAQLVAEKKLRDAGKP